MAATVEAQLRRAFDGMTPAERQLSMHLLSHYPVAGLGSITALAKRAKVSTPTVVRLVHKLGFSGYPEFQACLRAEVDEMLASPIAKHDRWAGRAPDTHVLNRFAEAVAANLQATLGQIDHAAFDAAAALLADPARHVWLRGGRITHALAAYLAAQLKVVRGGVTLLEDSAASWPPALLDIRPGDVLLVFDIRRYESSVLQTVEIAAEQGAEVVLVTDQWVSPAARHARHRFSAHVEAPSAWDSGVAILVLAETLLAAVGELAWAGAQDRMQRLEALYARTRFFRRF
jgi:DNA-binding MurR/RpiR family transcriptional regulator